MLLKPLMFVYDQFIQKTENSSLLFMHKTPIIRKVELKELKKSISWEMKFSLRIDFRGDKDDCDCLSYAQATLGYKLSEKF